MLELRPCCEHCGRDLGLDDLGVRICTFECTFCAACTDGVLGGVCPNCAGELVPRPIRPTAMRPHAPGATDRTHSPVDLEAHAARRAERPIDADHPGVLLRRYADAWLGDDLAGILAAYADDFVLHYFGANPFAGDHVGRDAALGVLGEVSARAPRTLRSVDDILVSDAGGALVVTETLERDGETATLTRVLRYRIEGGLFRECWLLDEDQALVDHLWRS